MKLLALTLFTVCAVVATEAQTAGGTFNGLFLETNRIAQQSSGTFSLATTASGAFSGKLQLGATRVSFTGAFLSGDAGVTVTPKNSNPLTIQLHLENPNHVTGTVSDGTWTAALAGDRAVFNAKTNATPLAGRYTLVFPGHYASSTEPAGDGYGTIAVDKAGKISLAGLLADGTKISQSATLSKDGRWPFYVLLYGGQGSVLSWITFTNAPDTDLSGDLRWIKPASAKAKLYPAGFTNETPLVGSFYQPPAAGSRALDFISAFVALNGGNLGQSISNLAILDANNQVRMLGSNKLTLTITPATGAFKGTATDPLTSKKLSFGGALLQWQNLGSGFFTGANQAGLVRFEPAGGDVIEFKTLGSAFAADLAFNGALPDFLRWSWSDKTSSGEFPAVSRRVGKGLQYLTVFPEGLLSAINIGFDGSDGGETTPLSNRPPQNVGAVRFAAPLAGLRCFAASYNPLAGGLDFTGFNSLEAIECFHCLKLQHVTITNLPSLRRLCLEQCDLQELDLTGDPALADVRAALNVFTNVVVAGGTGPNIWHWCTRNNPRLTQRFQDVMTNFFSLQELWIWDNHQDGALALVSTNLTSVKANDNAYTSADFSGQVNLKTCWLFNNSLANLDLAGCAALEDLQAQNNQLEGDTLDELLAVLDTAAPNLQFVNLTNNAGFPSLTGYNHYASLTNRGVVVKLDLP